jgi:hypothetical protein
MVAQSSHAGRKSKTRTTLLTQLLLSLHADLMQVIGIIATDKHSHNFVAGWLKSSPTEQVVTFVAAIVGDLNNSTPHLWQFLVNLSLSIPTITNLFLPELLSQHLNLAPKQKQRSGMVIEKGRTAVLKMLGAGRELGTWEYEWQ